MVRRPTPWFSPAVVENRSALGPPEDLLSEVQAVHEDLAEDRTDAEAQKAAWVATDFADRYRAYLETDPGAGAAVETLLDRLRDGEDLWLVCYENTDEKRCHRTILRAWLRERI